MARLNDPDAGLRKLVLIALEELGPSAQGAASAVAAILPHEKDPEILSFAVNSIRAFGVTPETIRALPEVAKLTQSSHSHLSWCAVYALAELGQESKEAFPLLAGVVKNETDSFSCRYTMAEALVNLAERFPELSPQVLAVSDELRESNPYLSGIIRKGIERPEVPEAPTTEVPE